MDRDSQSLQTIQGFNLSWPDVFGVGGVFVLMVRDDGDTVFAI